MTRPARQSGSHSYFERRRLTARFPITIYPYPAVVGIFPVGFDPGLIPTIRCRVTVVGGRGIIGAGPVGQHGIGLSRWRWWRVLIILIHVGLRPSVSGAVSISISRAVTVGIYRIVIRVVIISRRIIVAVWVVTVRIAVIWVAVA